MSSASVLLTPRVCPHTSVLSTSLCVQEVLDQYASATLDVAAACVGLNAHKAALDTVHSSLLQLCQRPVLHDSLLLQLLLGRARLLCQLPVHASADDQAPTACCSCVGRPDCSQYELYCSPEMAPVPEQHCTTLLLLEVQALQQLGTAGLLCHACWSRPCLQVQLDSGAEDTAMP